MHLVVVDADGRTLVVSHIEGAPSNTVDIHTADAEELDIAIGMVTRSVRRQLVAMLRTQG